MTHAQQPCRTAALFEEMWSTLTDLIGAAATANLIRRSLRRAVLRAPGLGQLAVTRDSFEYRYTLPPGWERSCEENLVALRELAGELKPLLVELTGPVVLHRLYGHPDLVRCNIFSPEQRP